MQNLGGMRGNWNIEATLISFGASVVMTGLNKVRESDARKGSYFLRIRRCLRAKALKVWNMDLRGV